MKYADAILRVVRAFKNETNFVGAESFRTKNPYTLDFCHTDKFATAYPSIKAISNEFMGIMPYTVDGNGKPVRSVVMDALYHPNVKDSSVAFFEKLAVSVLAHRKTYVLVWHRRGNASYPGGDIRANNIAGFTFLERPGVSRVDGKTYYNIGADRFSEDEVIEIQGGVNPSDLYGGYSPAEASIKWATLDQYIADYQSGFFLNGAVPAGKMVVTARTSKEFNDIVDSLEASHRGAGKNNGVTYVHRPIDPQSNKPVDAQIEWIPFATPNKDIDFESVFEQTNRRLDMAFGVSQFIKGVDDAPNYATAQVSEANFAKRAVNPLAIRIWTQFTHELNRITGGLGVAITFDYEIPAIADQEKIVAETNLLHATLINNLTAQGYTLDSIVDAFELSNAYKLLAKGNAPAVIDNDQADVDEGDEVREAPDPSKVDGTGLTATAKTEVTPKMELSDLEKLERAARNYMKSQVDRVIDEYSEEATNEVTPERTEDELEAFVNAMMLVIPGILLEYGEEGHEQGLEALFSAGLVTDDITPFTLTDEAKDGYRSYMRKVGDSYGKDTAESIRRVLATSQEEGYTLDETKKALREIMEADEYRVKRLGVTELNRSQGLGSVEAIKEIQAQVEVRLEKSLHHPGGAECEYCRALEGVWVAVDQPLIGLGETLIGADGGLLVNDFVENQGYDPHPNGKGHMIYRVVK